MAQSKSVRSIQGAFLDLGVGRGFFFFFFFSEWRLMKTECESRAASSYLAPGRGPYLSENETNTVKEELRSERKLSADESV